MARTYRSSSGPWFRLGRLEFGSVGVFCLMVVIGVVVWVIDPPGKPISTGLAMIGDAVLGGQIWRIVTWPFSGLGFSLWTLVNIYVLWYFGGELEALIGKIKMAWMLVAEVVTFALLNVVLTVVFQGQFAIAGPSLMASTVLLLYIAEYPRRPFFFGIPAWVLAAVIVGVSVVLMLGNRAWIALLQYLLSIALGALVAKQFGLLNDYSFIPRFVGGARRPTTRPAPTRPSPPPSRHPEHPSGGGRGGSVIDLRAYESQFGPNADPMPPGSPERRMDELLDKVASQGLSSLTPAERSELEALSKRHR